MRGFLSKQKTTFWRIGGALAGCVLLLALANALPQSVKERVTGNTLARQFLPLYRSLRKLPDIFFTPYLAAPNRLPRWSLTIAPQDILYLNSRLPTTSPFTSILLDSGRVFVDAEFSAPAYESAKVEVRYKGLNANHWNSFQKSYRVRFPGERLFEKKRAVSLTVPYDKRYYAEMLNNYRARKLGLLVPETRLVSISVNNQNHGVYLASEHWTKEMLAKHRVPDDSVLFGANDGSETLSAGPEAAYQNVFSLFSREGIAGWKSYTHALPSYDELETLLEIISYADDATFRRAIPRILDMEAFYKWDIVSILAGSDGSDFENLVLLFNTATGLFELVPFDLSYGALPDEYTEGSTLAKRILAIDEFRAARNVLLDTYLSDEKNLRDDLAYYDWLHQSARTAFFQDNAKKDTNFTFLAQVSDVRKAVEENFTKARVVLAAAHEPPPIVAARPLRFTGSFDRFAETYDTLVRFLARNPEFAKESERRVALLPGVHVFPRTVIVPAGLELIIYPNATLRLGAGVSLLSYSPVVARGLDGAPIRIERYDPARRWGSFVVQNTGEHESIFENVRIRGGSGARINGVTFTGMVALHNANASISDSFFANSGDDDAINPKYGRVTITSSVFEDTFSDAIDMDFAAPESRIEGNTFRRIGVGGTDVGGDAMDISWSDIVIANNTVVECTDKGVSVGENSHPRVEDNTIRRCDIGVAVKDSSRAEIAGNAIAVTRIGVAAYRKKDVFDGGTALVAGNSITDTETPYAADSYSSVRGATVVAPYTPAVNGQSHPLP